MCRCNAVMSHDITTAIVIQCTTNIHDNVCNNTMIYIRTVYKAPAETRLGHRPTMLSGDTCRL